MIDNFSILLSHGLLAIAFWYLLQRDDLDQEAPPTPDKEPEGFGYSRLKPGQKSSPTQAHHMPENEAGA